MAYVHACIVYSFFSFVCPSQIKIHSFIILHNSSCGYGLVMIHSEVQGHFAWKRATGAMLRLRNAERLQQAISNTDASISQSVGWWRVACIVIKMTNRRRYARVRRSLTEWLMEQKGLRVTVMRACYIADYFRLERHGNAIYGRLFWWGFQLCGAVCHICHEWRRSRIRREGMRTKQKQPESCSGAIKQIKVCIA